MPTTAEQILNEALSLPLEARADLTERLVARLAEDVPVEIARAQLDERCTGALLKSSLERCHLSQATTHWRAFAGFLVSTQL
jgi:hypothetical protein